MECMVDIILDIPFRLDKSMNKTNLKKANKLTSQISDLLSVLHPKKIRALSFYKDTYEEEKKAEKEGKQFYNFQVSTNIWDSDINNELLSEMQKYAEPRLKELREELRKL